MTSVLVLASVVLGLMRLRRHRRRRAWLNGPHYVEHIQFVKAERPMVLPAIKPLKAVAVSTRWSRESKEPLPFPRTGTT